MKILKILIFNFFTICFFFFFSILANNKTIAIPYYIAVTGSDINSGSITSPWATFDHAMTQIKPGDTLIIKDGTYYQSLNITVSGTETNTVTIKAENDGGTIIDGEHIRKPCEIKGTDSNHIHDIIVKGINCKNSKGKVFIISLADRISIKRVSAYNAGVGNNHQFLVYRGNNVLLEDTVASGSGRALYDIYESQNTTLRRCWGRWVTHSGGGGPNAIIQLYGSDDSIVENCIGTKDPTSSHQVSGIKVWAHTYNDTADRNKFYGNIVYGLSFWGYLVSSAKHRIEGNKFINNISINNSYGFFQRADADLVIKNMTIVGTRPGSSFAVQEVSTQPKDSDFEVKGDLRSSIILSGGIGLYIRLSPNFISFTNEYNDLYGLSTSYANAASQGTGEISVDPSFDISKYGKGSYLFIPNISPVKTAGENGNQMGAEVLYRYKDGVLTDIPLWPWPMEERIFRETGISVTWEKDGGLWKTLDGIYAPQSPKNLKQ